MQLCGQSMAHLAPKLWPPRGEYYTIVCAVLGVQDFVHAATLLLARQGTQQATTGRLIRVEVGVVKEPESIYDMPILEQMISASEVTHR